MVSVSVSASASASASVSVSVSASASVSVVETLKEVVDLLVEKISDSQDRSHQKRFQSGPKTRADNQRLK